MNWGIKLLQSSALPLGYGAVLYNMPKAQRILQGYYFYPLCQSTFAIIPQVMGKSQDLFLNFLKKFKIYPNFHLIIFIIRIFIVFLLILFKSLYKKR